MTEAETKLEGFPAVRKPKTPSILVGGAWQADGSFKPHKAQPEPATSELAEANAFYRAKGPGTTEYVRRVTGKLVVEKVEKTSASFS